METNTLTHIALYKEFKVADSIEKKMEIFKIWLEAIVKFNLSIHVGWLTKESGDNTPDFIKVQLVNFFQKPPSIGTCLSLSRSINNLIEKRNKTSRYYLPFQQIFYHHDELYSRLLELRNAHAHSTRNISAEELEGIAADMRTIANNPFYRNINLSFIMLSAHLLEQGNLTDKGILDQAENRLYVPVIEIDLITNGSESVSSTDITIEYSLTTVEKIPLFPISVTNKLGNIFYWNQRKGQHGSYNSYDLSTETINVKNITLITGFPFDDWKRSSDPLFVKYLELRNRISEISQIEASISLSSLSDNINLVKHIENEINLDPSDCMEKSQWLDVLYRRVTLEQDIEIRKYYLKYIVIKCEAEVNKELINMALNCVEALFDCELDKRKQSGLVAYYIKVLISGFRVGLGINIRLHKMKVLIDKRRSKYSLFVYKYQGVGFMISLILFCSLLFIYNHYITILATVLSASFLRHTFFINSYKGIFLIPLKEINVNSEFKLPHYLYMHVINNLYKATTFKKHGPSLFGKILNFPISEYPYLLGGIQEIRFQDELYKYFAECLKEGVTNNAFNKIDVFITDMWEYVTLSQYIIYIYMVVRALEDARYLNDITKYGNILHNLNNFKNENLDKEYLNIWLNVLRSTIIEENLYNEETASNLNLLEIKLWQCEVRALKHESDAQKLLEMKKFRQRIYNENKSASEDKTKPLDIVERIAARNIWEPAAPFIEETLIRTRGIWLYEIGMVNEAIQELYLSLNFNKVSEMPYTLYNIALLEGLRKNAISCFSVLKKLKRYLDLLDDEETQIYSRLVSLTDMRLASFGAVDISSDFAIPPNWDVNLFYPNLILISPNEVRSMNTYSQQ